jgi:hypothetical protein
MKMHEAVMGVQLGLFMTALVGLVACCCYRMSRPSPLRKS